MAYGMSPKDIVRFANENGGTNLATKFPAQASSADLEIYNVGSNQGDLFVLFNIFVLGKDRAAEALQKCQACHAVCPKMRLERPDKAALRTNLAEECLSIDDAGKVALEFVEAQNCFLNAV